MQRILIWGTGNYYRVWGKWLPKEYEIIGFISSDRSQGGTVFEGKRVFAPDQIKGTGYDKIIIASSYQNEIYESILKQGIDREKVEILQFDKAKFFPFLNANRRKIKTFYAYNENVGDLLNAFLQDVLFGVNTEWTEINSAELISLGSVLERLLRYEKGEIKGEKIKVWGSGFMNFPNADYAEFIRPLDVLAVRGRYTLEIIRDISGDGNINCAVGDPGLLASLLIEQPPKQYDIGIIPHYREIDNPVFQGMRNMAKNVKLINMRENPIKVIKDIAGCETILSNSLHGLIIADSFCIPNLWIRIGSQTRGNVLFKYYDYYSAYPNMSPTPVSIRDARSLRISDIERNYKITPEMVKDKQQELMDAWR